MEKYVPKLNKRCEVDMPLEHHINVYAAGMEQYHVWLSTLSAEEITELNTKMDTIDQLPRDKLKNLMDLDKIIVVDNQKALDEAIEFMKETKEVAIDIEGSFPGGGIIYLI
mmetsp:Transcript_31552/g.28728  ORF Transcript_31552/g.28728 Transcript_31552/m.28728 type:complete len:111 (-) Transcript_31552:86-418(-)